jgi:hypothetical protein
MASRTPRLQLRSQYNPHWGEFATAADLPNTAGNPLSASALVLQPGDLAFVTGDGTYECVTAGAVSATPPAVWQKTGGGPGGDYVDTIEGFSAGGYYEADAGVAQGGANFSAVWYGYFVDFLDGASQFLIGHSSGGLPGGYALVVEGRSGTSAVIPYAAQALDGGLRTINEIMEQTQVWHRASAHHVAISVESGVGLRSWVDGVKMRFSPEPFGNYDISPTGRFRVGRGGFFGFAHAQKQGFVGAGYLNGLLTDDAVQEHLQACRDGGFRFVAGSVGWQHRWDVRDTFVSPGPAPAVIPDLEGNGGNLALVGALTQRQRRI